MAKKKAIIVDIDGCLADSEISHMFEKEIASGKWEWFSNRLDTFEPFSWAKPFIQSLIHSPCGLDIIFLTARQVDYMQQTIRWLNKHLNVDASDQKVFMFMRPMGDKSGSAELKKNIYNSSIKKKWDVLFAIDDRPNIIEMWKSLGVPSMLVFNTESKIEDEVRKTFNIT